MNPVGRPRGSGHRPPHAVVRRCAWSAANEAHIGLSEVLTSRCGVATRARRAAWLSILAETGCTKSGLADVWGCHRQAIQRALKPASAA